MRGRIFTFLFGLLGLLFLGTVTTYAAENTPSFPSCGNPSGTTVASYADGTHGIPGDSTTYTGSDSVYAVDGNRVLQCFCGGSQGIQTDWLKVGNLSSSQVSYWQSQGWTYVPDGSAWGLDSTGYVAYNAGYTCSSNNPNSGGNSSTGGGVVTPTCNDTIPSSAPVITSIVAGQNSVTLTWTPAGDPVSYYLIAYGTSAGNYTFGDPNVGNVTAYTINNLSGGQVYYFVVKGVNGCMPGPFSNEVSNNVSGGYVAGAATGFSVLGAATDPKTQTDSINLTKSICAACFWWPVLLGEVLALVAFYLLLRKRHVNVNKYLMGTFIGLLAYVVFLMLNHGQVCLDGGIGFWKWSIPCHYFWVLDALMVLLFSWLIRGVSAPVKTAKRK